MCGLSREATKGRRIGGGGDDDGSFVAAADAEAAISAAMDTIYTDSDQNIEICACAIRYYRTFDVYTYIVHIVHERNECMSSILSYNREWLCVWCPQNDERQRII